MIQLRTGDGDFDIDMSGLEQYQRDRLSNFHRLRTWKHLSPQVSRECLNEISFNGLHFYNVYKHAEFLTKDNVKRLLAQGYKIRQKLWTMEPGRSVVIEGMYLQRNVPLRVKKTGPPRVVVGHLEFTYNRLIGLAAAYAYEHRQSFPSIVSSAAEALGLQWDQHDDEQCKLYLSAAPGAELFVDQFSFLPLLCAMRKYQLNRLPAELVTKIGSVKNADGRTMGQVLKSNMASAERIWSMFPSAHEDLQTLIKFSRHLNSLFQE